MVDEPAGGFDHKDVLHWFIDNIDFEGHEEFFAVAVENPYVHLLLEQARAARLAERFAYDALGHALCAAMGLTPDEIGERLDYSPSDID